MLQTTVYTFGFIFAIIERTELFTEHTTLAVIPVLDGQASLSELGQLWSLVLLGNLIGFSHLPYCIAANAEVVAGMVAGANISVLEWARFEAIATFGNSIGGTVFVGLLNYSFAVRGADERDVYIESDSEEDSDTDL